MLQEYRISDDGKQIVYDKVFNAIELLKMHEPPEGYYVAFSGGKDSVVILDLVKRAGVKYDAHYNVTTVDPPELVQFIKKEHPEVGWNMPEMSIWQLVVDKGFPPMRHIRYCCSVLKEGGGGNRIVVTGVRRAESFKRSKRRTVENCIKDSSKTFLNIIVDWSDEDVWEHINFYFIPYCSLYDEGYTRLGCVMCPMASVTMRKREARRWPKIARAWERAITKCHNKRLSDGKSNTEKTGHERYVNWLNGVGNKYDPDQGVLFE